ncbi:MAG: endolytic transglycosylase MltG [Candidatus Paceibacterota bacterium]
MFSISRIQTIIAVLFLCALILPGLFYRLFFREDIQILAPQIRITIPEGYTTKDIAERLKNFRNFNKEEFLKIAEDKEGYLFPDTYFFTSKEMPEEIIEKMENNFKVKAGDVQKDILIMASIIEKEARNKEDRRIISGILWKRLKINMPLQVDVSLYTYDNKGLPPMPICNPGLDAIDAAKNPVDSKYWYYLSDKKGVTHFARTFEEHKRNRAKYGI